MIKAFYSLKKKIIIEVVSDKWIALGHFLYETKSFQKIASIRPF